MPRLSSFIYRCFILLAVAAFFAACNSSSSSTTTPGGDTGGSTSKAAITSDNAKDVAEDVYFASDDLSATTTGLVSGLDTSDDKMKDAVTKIGVSLKPSGTVPGLYGGTASYVMERVLSSGTVPGLYGGTASYVMERVLSQFTLTLTFVNYSNFYQETINGVLVATGEISGTDEVSEMSITATGFRYTYADMSDSSITGAMVLMGNATSASLKLNADLTDHKTGTTGKVEDFVVATAIDAATQVLTYTIDGTFTQSAYGSVVVDTTTDFMQDAGSAWAKQGVMVITGADNSKARLTILDVSSYKVEADADGDGTYEYDSGPLYYVEGDV